MNAMHQSGHSTDEIRCEPNHTKKTRSRKRNIIWFNPPYSEHVQTNIGTEFLRLLSKHFSPHHKLHKIINKSNVKISCSCMASMGAVIKKHNAELLSSETTARNNNQTPSCNCRNKPSCPLGGKCRDKSIIYKAAINTLGGHKERLPSFTAYNPHFFSPKMSLKTGVRIICGNIFFAFFPTVKFTVAEKAQVIRWAIFGDSPIHPSFGRGSSQIL